MLNLSDKELDRLSREAAQEHDPGDVLGPRSWEKLEPRLDGDLGKFSPNPMRAVRRLPFYYASAVILLLGVTAYFVRQNSKTHQGSGSPPFSGDMTRQAQPGQQGSATAAPDAQPTTTNPSSTKIDDHKEKSTPAASSTVNYPATAQQGTSLPADKSVATTAGADRETASAAAAGTGAVRTGAGVAPRGATAPGNADAAKTANAGMTADVSHNRRTHFGTGRAGHYGISGTDENGSARESADGMNAGVGPAVATTRPTRDRSRGRVGNAGGKGKKNNLVRDDDGAVPGALGANAGAGVSNSPASGASAGATSGAAGAAAGAEDASQARAIVQKPLYLRKTPSISDSALRASAKTMPIQLIKKKPGLRINRSLEFGLTVAPDFSSVNSMAGDKAGSTWGLTVDYQFASRWYIGTGLLFSRKNYAASAQDYHVPSDYYRVNNLKNVDYVKGSFNMIEIPLNLRYDFSVSGNTMFFASAGVSSYLGASENCNYYYDFFGRISDRSVQYPGHNNYLFSAVNLSLGVEAGISNSLSLLVAPYVKLPSRNLGFGQVDMNSFGINLALKFAPVISRKRH